MKIVPIQKIPQKLHLLPTGFSSPPSPPSRLSDSDLSELDLCEYDSEFDLHASRGKYERYDCKF